MRRSRGSRWLWAPLFFTAVLCAQLAEQPAFKLLRLSDHPILAPRGDGWESAGTFNPSVVEREGKIVMLYRAQDKHGTSRLGYAESTDGIHFFRKR